MDVDEDGGNATENGIMDVPLPQEAPCVAQPQSHSQVAVSPSAASASDVSMESLFSKFGCMQTLDRKDLIEQVRRLVGDNITDEAAVFYLEMNQFNVAAAVGSYFDLEAGAEAKATPPQMMFVRDVTIGEGESVPPNTMFIKTWQVQNSSPTEVWPEGCKLCFTQGHSQLRLSTHSVPVRSLLPWQKTDISVELRSPGEAGIYEFKWRMSTANGLYFGDTIWVIITVEPSGTLALTQQMDKFSTTDNEGDGGGGGGGGSGTSSVDTPAISHAQNPFAVRHNKTSEDQTMQ